MFSPRVLRFRQVQQGWAFGEADVEAEFGGIAYVSYGRGLSGLVRAFGCGAGGV